MNLVEYETTAAPGAEGASLADGSSAGTSNAVTPPATPENVPYSRFKEVNDQLRPFKELTDLGYDADSLRRLADWEMEFTADPAAAWMSLAERLDDLPEPVRNAVAQLRSGSPPAQPTDPGPPSVTQGAPPAETQETGYEEPPAWAEPLIQDFVDRREQAENEQVAAANREVLQGILQKWNARDKEEGIEIPDTVKLSFIAGAARSATDVEGILDTARTEAIEYRNSLVGGLAPRPGVEAPRSVPGGAVATPAPPVTPTTLAEATRMAKADLEAGRLQR